MTQELKENQMKDPLKPALSLLVKLGSIAVHVDEMLSPKGHEFDRHALGSLLQDHEVTEWLASMEKSSFIPKKR